MFNSVSTYLLFAYEILNDCFNSVFNIYLNEISFYEFFFMQFQIFLLMNEISLYLFLNEIIKKVVFFIAFLNDLFNAISKKIIVHVI